MKATGIVRRIDDLGRVVIPKEIRRTDNMDMVGDVLLRNAGSGKKNRPGLYIMTKPAGSTVGIREGSLT